MIGLNRGLVPDPAVAFGGVSGSRGRGHVRDSTRRARRRTSEYTQ
ncbi:MAG TPA: hypothetical protein VMG13_04690 [Trebonia sp.]|nr:hypothetical protein [Trebonia sp.]